MKMSILTAVITGALLLSSCAVKPRPISYGEDMCHYCSMTIVDKSHAAQVVNGKGKAYKFDAIECMLNFRTEGEEPDMALFLVTDLYGAGELTDATLATYLKCEQIPSPMGAYLSAFEESGRAAEVHRELGGQLLTWEELQSYFAFHFR